MEQSFREECKEWLSPFGYTVWAHSDNGNFIEFVHEDTNKPSIACWNADGNKQVQVLCSGDLKLLFRLEAGPLAFKHPDIDKYIEIGEFYAKVIDRHNPFSNPRDDD